MGKRKNTRKTKRVLASSDISTINPENLQLVDSFLMYCTGVDRSPVTVTNYRSDLYIFFSWFRDKCQNKDFCEVKKNDYLNFQGYMLSEGLSPARIKRVRSSLSSLSKYIENFLDEEPKWKGFRNIILKIEAPAKENVREKTVLSDEQCQKFLDHLVEKKQYQKACAFALAWASGSRVSELVQFKCDYFTDDCVKWNKFWKTPEKLRTKGRGKLGKQIPRYVLIDKFEPYLNLWLEERKRLGVPDKIQHLFVKYDKKTEEWVPLKTQTLKSWAVTFGNWFDVSFYFHCLRHNFCTELGRAGYPPELIKAIVNWESLDMVSLYDDRDADDLIEAFLNAA